MTASVELLSKVLLDEMYPVLDSILGEGIITANQIIICKSDWIMFPTIVFYIISEAWYPWAMWGECETILKALDGKFALKFRFFFCHIIRDGMFKQPNINNNMVEPIGAVKVLN